MPEQFTFEQRFGQGGTVDRNERSGGAHAFLMDRPCHQFLAGAGFTTDKNTGSRRRYLCDLTVYVAHGRAVTDHLIGLPPVFQVFTQLEIFLFKRMYTVILLPPYIHGLGNQIGNRLKKSQLTVERYRILHRHPVNGECTDHRSTGFHRNAEKCEIGNFDVFTRTGPVEKLRFLIKGRDSDRSARGNHLSGEPLSRPVLSLSFFLVGKPPGNINRNFVIIGTENGNHAGHRLLEFDSRCQKMGDLIEDCKTIETQLILKILSLHE